MRNIAWWYDGGPCTINPAPTPATVDRHTLTDGDLTDAHLNSGQAPDVPDDVYAEPLPAPGPTPPLPTGGSQSSPAPPNVTARAKHPAF